MAGFGGFRWVWRVDNVLWSGCKIIENKHLLLKIQLQLENTTTTGKHQQELLRCNSNREFFDCDPEYIKSIITVVGSTIDTLKSCYKHISNDELTSRLQ